MINVEEVNRTTYTLWHNFTVTKSVTDGDERRARIAIDARSEQTGAWTSLVLNREQAKALGELLVKIDGT